MRGGLVREFTIYVNHNYSLDLILFQRRRKLRRARISIIGHASVSLHTALLCPLPLCSITENKIHAMSFQVDPYYDQHPLSPLSPVRTLTLQCPVFNFVDIENPFILVSCLEQATDIVEQVWWQLLHKLTARETHINNIKTKRRPLYLKTQSVPRCKHFSSRL